MSHLLKSGGHDHIIFLCCSRFVKDEEEIESICYYNYYRQSGKGNNQHLICFILVDGANNLDLFRNELDIYFEDNLKTFFEGSDKVIYTLYLR